MSFARPSGKVKCPNHGCELEGLPFPLTEKGQGMCPVSRCMFDYQVEVDKTEEVVDKSGNISKKLRWSASGNE
jgi:hypothetical protein